MAAQDSPHFRFVRGAIGYLRGEAGQAECLSDSCHRIGEIGPGGENPVEPLAVPDFRSCGDHSLHIRQIYMEKTMGHGDADCLRVAVGNIDVPPLFCSPAKSRDLHNSGPKNQNTSLIHWNLPFFVRKFRKCPPDGLFCSPFFPLFSSYCDARRDAPSTRASNQETSPDGAR